MLKFLKTWCVEKEIPWYLRAPLIIALVVLAFFAGKFTTPVEVQEMHTTETKWKEKDLHVDKSTKARSLVTKTAKLIEPNGTIHESTETREEESAKADISNLVERSGLQKESETKITIAQPKWRVGALVGASLTTPAIPITGPLVLGAHAEMRLVGGVWVGAWAITSGQAGGSVSVEF